MPAISLRQPLSLVVALLVLALGAGLSVSSPASAAEGGAFYRAELAQPAPQPVVIVDGVAWRCTGTVCTAAKNNSRDAIVCARLARQVGALTGFASRARALEGDDLARCNKG